jgi:hypothetical protein
MGDFAAAAILWFAMFCFVFTVASIGGVIYGYTNCAHQHDVFRCQMNVYWTPAERNPQ